MGGLWPPPRTTVYSLQEQGGLLKSQLWIGTWIQNPVLTKNATALLRRGLVCFVYALFSSSSSAFFNGDARSVTDRSALSPVSASLPSPLLSSACVLRARPRCGVGVAFGRTRRARCRNQGRVLAHASSARCVAACSLGGGLGGAGVVVEEGFCAFSCCFLRILAMGVGLSAFCLGHLACEF